MRLGWTAALLALAFFLLGLLGAFHFHSPDGGVSMYACAVCLHLQGGAHAAVRASAALVFLPSISQLSASSPQQSALKVSLFLPIGRAPPA
jgi:hypothetical protein